MTVLTNALASLRPTIWIIKLIMIVSMIPMATKAFDDSRENCYFADFMNISFIKCSSSETFPPIIRERLPFITVVAMTLGDETY